MLKLECSFRDLRGKNFTKSFRYFQLSDKDLPSYYSKPQIKSQAWKLKEGDYVETKDDYIVPLIRSWKSFVRTPSQTHSRWNLANGEPIYFKPPEKKHQCFGERGSGNLTQKQRSFCQYYVRTGDENAAYKLAGYSLNKRAFRNWEHAKALLKQSKIKNRIAEELRLHLKATNSDEAEFFVKRMTRLQDSLESVLETLTKKIEYGISKEEAFCLNATVKNAIHLAKFNAELLGYTNGV